MSVLDSDPRTLSREAYTYLYPLVTMELTRRQMCNAQADERPGFGPANRFSHIREFPPADFRVVVRPNFDTLYSSGWIDLTAGPVQIDVPDSDDRYYMLPMLDMWTDVFANPGKRTTGTGAQSFVLTAPGYEGPVPAGATRIEAPTVRVWIIGRTQTNGPADYAAVRTFQDRLRITELGGRAEHIIDPDLDMQTEPLRLVNAMSAVEFLAFGAELMKVYDPHHTDFSQLSRMELLGLVPGQDFDPSRFDASQLAEIEAGAVEARETLASSLPKMGQVTNGWMTAADTMGVYGNYYLKRALVTEVGLGANPAEDAVYPVLITDASGLPLSGQHRYVMHFDADKLPPVSAFWSITMYDAEGFQVANEINRFAIGDRDELVFNPDGSLDIYLQHVNPGPERVSNWLPSPEDALGVTMRLYAPGQQVLHGTWTPPAVRRVE